MYVFLIDLVWPSGFLHNLKLKIWKHHYYKFLFLPWMCTCGPWSHLVYTADGTVVGVYLIFDILYRWHKFTSLLLACILRAVQVRPLGACTPSVCLLFRNLNMLFAIRVCYRTFLHLSDACNICQDFISIWPI